MTINLNNKLTVITSTLSRHISRSVLQVNPKFQNISSSDKKEIIWQIISNGRSISSNVLVELPILYRIYHISIESEMITKGKQRRIQCMQAIIPYGTEISTNLAATILKTMANFS